MKKFCLLCSIVVCLSTTSLVGCGSGTETKVIEATPPAEPTKTPEEEEAYAKAMEESMK